MVKCNKRDDIFEKDTGLESHLLKRHESENDFKCDECDFMCAGLVTLRKHSNMKHPKALNNSETAPTVEARKESLKKSDNKFEVSDTPQCETPVVCELIGCCWCKYQT